jgi:benzil reductase ((S)-benzoin forming)
MSRAPWTPAQELPPGVVVVSGASRGIGRDLVELLLATSRDVVGVARHPAGANCDGPDPGRYTPISADLSSEAGITEGIAQIRQALGGRPVAALVNGAGAVTPVGPLTQQSSGSMLAALCLMAVAPARLAAGLAGSMPRGGRILNLSTRSAHETFPGLGLYCMSKHALHSVTESLQLELSPRIAVAELIPGEVDTAMQADLRRPDQDSFAMAEFFRGNRANLIPSIVAARFCQWVLTKTSESRFNNGSPWYIYDTENQGQWLPAGTAFPYPEP